ncbi:hypothetical protein HF394_19895 (plasmid) [Planococcus glaciei]|uniref:Uncharacterized protein n=1 Tax=Planococcus glaciei TaxID=459472 RepID=A0A7H8QI80_9BACL|nr:hypothetical protein [Planococcus glaciei]QDY47014.1 hypothetical protein FK545_20760 [Planococcus glaciei]QKX52893.1 hypothetical protein HF394_19895 [Planococcus glaciei]
MNKRKWIKWVVLAVPFLLLLAFAWSYAPHKVVSIEPAKVSKIAVSDENSIKLLEITEESEINHLVSNLNKTIFQKGAPSIGDIAFSYRAVFFDEKGEVIQDLTINSRDTMTYKGFFYKSEDEAIAYEYIEELVSK